MKSLLGNLSHIPLLWRWILGIIVVALIGYASYWYMFAHKEPVDNDIIYSGTPTSVIMGDLKQTITFNGTTAFSNTQKLTFGQTNLKVTQVLVKVGDQVRPGQILATVDTSELDKKLSDARRELKKAKEEYEQEAASNSEYYKILEAENKVQSAKNALENIETTIRIKNSEDDRTIEIAQKDLDEAKKNYDSLSCNDSSCQNRDSTIRKKRETYQDAIENLRVIATDKQVILDNFDKLMYFSTKYNQFGYLKPNVGIGHNEPGSITKTSNQFFATAQIVKDIQVTYDTLSNKNIDTVTVSDIESAYMQVKKLGNALKQLGTVSHTMFSASLIDWSIAGQDKPLAQEDIDKYISDYSNTFYKEGTSINTSAESKLDIIYKIDDTLNVTTAKQTRQEKQNALNTLLVKRSNRNNDNQKMKIDAQLAIVTAQQELSKLKNGTSNDDALTKLHVAQDEVTRLVKQYESYSLIANFAGTVTETKIQVGDAVTSTNDTYIYVENPNLIDITLQVGQSDILQLNKGDMVEISLDVYPGEIFSGILSEISTVPSTTSEVGSYTAKVTFEKPEGKRILGGMSATVVFTMSQKENVLIIPNSAVSTKDGFYYVTKPDKTKHIIEIGESDISNTEVISGLSLGDEVLSITISAGDLEISGVTQEDTIEGMEGEFETPPSPGGP